MPQSQWRIHWHDHGREPQCAPDPRYPQGIHVDVSLGAVQTCEVSVPYPAKRCGYYTLRCTTCGFSCAITTAGRVDDPCAVKVPCKSASHNN